MTQVDASIPLASTGGFDLGKAMSLANLAQQMRVQQHQIQSENALKTILANPQAYDPTGQIKPEAMQSITSLDPDMGMKLRANQQEEQLRKVQMQHYETDIGRQKFDFMTGVAGGAVDAYNDAKSKGASEPEATAAARAFRNEAAKNNGGFLDEATVNQVTGAPFDPNQAKVMAGMNPEWSKRQREQATEKRLLNKDAEDKRHDLETEKIAKDKVAAAGASHFTPEMGQLMAAFAEQGVSIPAGFRSKEQQINLYQGLIDRNPGKTPEEIVSLAKTGQIEFGAQKKETQTAAGVAGKVEVAENEINEFVPLVREASAKVPRDNFVPLNKLMQAADSSISDPNLKALKIRINSVLNAYDMLAARGGTDKDKRAEVRNLLLSADGPDALEAGLKSFEVEAAAAHRAAVKATKVPELPEASGEKKADAPPKGIPAGSTLIGHTPDGREVWQSADGKKRVP